MSVPSGKRGLSVVQYVHNASEMYKLAMKVFMSMPNRYTVAVGTPLLNMSRQIASYTSMANSIYPVKTYADYELRRTLNIRARATCFALSTELSNLLWIKKSFEKDKTNTPMSNIKESTLINWLELLDKETSLITGVLNSDTRKYSKLPVVEYLNEETGQLVNMNQYVSYVLEGKEIARTDEEMKQINNCEDNIDSIMDNTY